MLIRSSIFYRKISPVDGIRNRLPEKAVFHKYLVGFKDRTKFFEMPFTRCIATSISFSNKDYRPVVTQVRKKYSLGKISFFRMLMVNGLLHFYGKCLTEKRVLIHLLNRDNIRQGFDSVF